MSTALSAADTQPCGTLVLVVGPSGGGKDTLISAAQTALTEDTRFAFPRRFITRPPGIGEDHIPVSDSEFDHARNAGKFSLFWSAHGLRYALSKEIDDLLMDGRNVIANVSRTVIDVARVSYPLVSVILVTASADIIAKRLRQRGRENQVEIARRLNRASYAPPTGRDVMALNNEGPVDDMAREFLSLLEHAASQSNAVLAP